MYWINVLKGKIKGWLNFHKPGTDKNFFLFTMPRSGSTWLMEILSTQPNTKYCNEPLYLKNSLVRKYSGIESWTDMHDSSKKGVMRDYFEKLNNGELGFLNPNPLGDYYTLFSNRIVYKIIHGGEDRISWLANEFNGYVIYLIRHPIAVGISHQQVLRLDAMIAGEYGANFNKEQIRVAKDLIASGSLLEKAVLSWCLQNFVPLKTRSSDWVFVTYEQLVMEPEVVLNYLQRKLGLVNLEQIKKDISKPSLVKNLSDTETVEMLSNLNTDKSVLLSKWRKKVSKSEEAKLFDIIAVFEIDVYSVGSDYPDPKYQIAD